MVKKRGLSLAMVLAIVTIMMLVAAAMTAIFTMNLNLTQGYYNGTIAEKEAEAGINELMYRLSEDANYGRAGQEIRGTTSPDFDPRECYHVITFAGGGGFARSTNNTNGDSPSGSLGRTIPTGHIHVVSTGFCRGVYRTVEAVIAKPPNPFGIATSGKIHSRDPLTVKGIEDPTRIGADERPGHIVCNSPDGVIIEQGPDTSRHTQVSGFIKTVGDISLDPNAEVVGGLRPKSSPTQLLDIDLSKFNTAGKSGTANIIDASFNSPQVLDILYYAAGDLTYNSSVRLNNGVLYCAKDLIINGSVSGVGAIVARGKIEVNNGVSLSGIDGSQVALLADGPIVLRGGGNYFRGLVYSRTNIDARNIVVLGGMVVNNPDPAGGDAELENVTIYNDESVGEIKFTVVSSSQVTTASEYTQPTGGGLPLVGVDDGGVVDAQGNPIYGVGGYTGENWTFGTSPEEIEKLNYYLSNSVKESYKIGNTPLTALDMSQIPSDAGGLVDMLGTMNKNMVDWETALEEIKDLEQQIRLEKDKLDPDPDADNSAIESTITSLEKEKTKQEGIRDAAEAAYDQAVNEFVNAYTSYAQQHPAANGSYHQGGTGRLLDVTINYDFNFNEYLPQSDALKITMWHQINGRP
ncbi:MAG: hypothetical protein KC910_30950 [Candidatus Eremiobacteraeota bacterium]|nr:hypothetical protein [Candidatus Eremiobacteraeota bacterium]